jgi:hypothetical protein
MMIDRIWRAGSAERVRWVPASSEYLAARPHLLARDELPAFLAGSGIDRPFIHDVRASASIVSFFDDGPRLAGSHWGRNLFTSRNGGAAGVPRGEPGQRVELAIAPRNLVSFEDHYARAESAAFVQARLGARTLDGAPGPGSTVARGLDQLGVDAVLTGTATDNPWLLPWDAAIIRVVHDGMRPQLVPADPGSWAWRNRSELKPVAALATVGVVAAASHASRRGDAAR